MPGKPGNEVSHLGTLPPPVMPAAVLRVKSWGGGDCGCHLPPGAPGGPWRSRRSAVGLILPPPAGPSFPPAETRTLSPPSGPQSRGAIPTRVVSPCFQLLP